MTRRGYAVALVAAAIVVLLAIVFRGHGHRALGGIVTAVHGR
jgi:hypothetical protein